jgi:hypothetical protein
MNHSFNLSDESIETRRSKKIKAMIDRKLIIVCLIVGIVLVAGFIVKNVMDKKQTEKSILWQDGAVEMSSKKDSANKSKRNNANAVPNQVDNQGVGVGDKTIVDSRENGSAIEDSFRVPR